MGDDVAKPSERNPWGRSARGESPAEPARTPSSSEKAGFRKLSTCSSTNEEGVQPSADLNVGEPERSDGVNSEVSIFNTYLPFDDGLRLRVFDVMSMRFIQDDA